MPDRSAPARAPTDPGTGFHAFVAARSGALFWGALVLTGSREAAEDLVQETLERTCRRWRTIADKDAPDAYVRRIMVNVILVRCGNRCLPPRSGGKRLCRRSIRRP
ncbi:sigma factor [Streptomyces sp. NPDC091387]|uniref:sigma factor n=1 Tax=Streptomyces sp. NPDC091387 TaxID=3365998 RepID=UPI0037FBBEF6